ncbi:hypothetical protein BDV27DRAFT_153037 [Aspergillus caelatus]|uniref:NmrA-like domain-containing protein n=1 Tax=Aspergillus caelatus TaxID=61420 RepID=A0A5N7AKM9_9EURO|nr:uncharacterized protein BDV27DRAFT_153037 [Aspergillus caelatus]KAE8369549.1 hypothetical protein BDV27DRAFT_153037 [Aspergillus caelatus]
MASTIAVVGATGKQGGSVARSLLQNPSFKVRAVTRNKSSDASQSLASAGADVVQANGFNHEEMVAALKGASGLYMNINSDDKAWRDPAGPTEFDLGKSIVDAAIEAGVETFVYSGGPPCTELTGGKVSMKAMDMKYRVEQYARETGRFQTIVIVNPAWYFENFLVKEVAPVFGGFPFFPDSEGFLTFRVPHWGGDNQVPFLNITEDYGDIVHGIFLEPTRWNGRVIHGASDLIGFDQLTATFESVTGQKSRFEPILPNWEAFDTHGIPELEDVKLMFGFTQNTGGRYFGEEASEINTATELKRIVAHALGRPEEKHQLQTAKGFFRANFQ